MANNEQATPKDAVRTDIGMIHVMPAVYQGGKMPEGSKAAEPRLSLSHRVEGHENSQSRSRFRRKRILTSAAFC